jgi:hypothetical protein
MSVRHNCNNLHFEWAKHRDINHLILMVMTVLRLLFPLLSVTSI